MNIKTRALTKEEFKLIIKTMKEGFRCIENDKEKVYQPNNRIASLLILQANLGLRIGDILKLRLNDIVKDGDRYRLDIEEEKTGKKRTFTVPLEVYNFLKIYTLENKISSRAVIFPITKRTVQKHLKSTCNYLGLEKISTHSFRKFFSTEIYLNNDCDIVLVQKLLQHSNIATTQKYIGINETKVEKALSNHICLP